MNHSVADDKFREVVRKIDPGSRLLRAWPLAGGVSAQVTALEIERPDGQTVRMVVRRHGALDLRRNPNVAAAEYTLLQQLHAAGLPTPAPYYLDQTGDILGAPYLVVEYVEGQPEFALAKASDLLVELAAHLARIHRLDGGHLDLSFLPKQADVYAAKLRTRPAQMDDSLEEGRIRDFLAPTWPWPQRNPTVLLHGDFWPGNALWRERRLVAIVDWEDASTGDPLEDLANSRLEMLWAFGSDGMHQFTRHYQAQMPIDYTCLPYWDLCAALRPAFRLADWARDAAEENTMRERHHWFVAQAFKQL